MNSIAELNDYINGVFEQYLFNRNKTIFLPEGKLYRELNFFDFKLYGFKNLNIHTDVLLELSDILINWDVPRGHLRCQENILNEWAYYRVNKNIGMWVAT